MAVDSGRIAGQHGTGNLHNFPFQTIQLVGVRRRYFTRACRIVDQNDGQNHPTCIGNFNAGRHDSIQHGLLDRPSPIEIHDGLLKFQRAGNRLPSQNLEQVPQSALIGQALLEPTLQCFPILDVFLMSRAPHGRRLP